jgi:20S proteasome alpha/beta subunit
MEEEIFSKIGLNLKEFYEKNQAISPQIVNLIIDAMAKYNYGLTILIAGVDDLGPHLFRIDNPAKVDTYDAIGHCAIGSGDVHAISTFIANDYDPNLDLNHVAAMTYEAKKRSEKAQGVGVESDLYIVCNNRVVKMPDYVIKKLDQIYSKREERERQAVADIQSEIEKLDIEKIEKEG